MSKITLNGVGNIIDATTAATTINNNNTVIKNAIDNTLSRDGTAPNQMAASLDMNSNRILNLPAPLSNSEPVRLIDFVVNISGRIRLKADANYYVRRDGNDNNTGLINSSSSAWLTIGKALSYVSQTLDLAGFTVIVHVQGNNVGDGTYTENLILPSWVGYHGGTLITPFTDQFIILGENGTAKIIGATASPTILAVGTGGNPPIQFNNFEISNPNTSGICIEADDGGFVVLKTITFGTVGTGGLLTIATQTAGRILFINSTFTVKTGVNVAAGFYATSGGELVFQPGSIINFAGATTFSAAVVYVFNNGLIDNGGTTWSGTTPTGNSYFLDKTTNGFITTPSLIVGSLGPSLTPIGYSVGGGTVTQITSRATGVTLNRISGDITLIAAVNAAVSPATAQTITVTNNIVASNDTINVVQKSGTDKYLIFVTNVAAGSFQITWYTTGGTTNESPVFHFNVIRGVNV